MGLFGFGKKKQPSMPAQKSSASIFDEDLTHLTPDGELPFGWHYANKDYVDQIKKQMRFWRGECYDAELKGIEAERRALEQYISLMQAVLNTCNSKGECFAFWATTIMALPLLISESTERLEYINANFDDLLAREQLQKKLRSELPEIIAANPGILQTDVYKMFPPEAKHQVSNELYRMSGNGTIERKKQGRTYSLIIK